MAGDNNNPNSKRHPPSSQRKSRWESSSSATLTTTTTTNHVPISTDSKSTINRPSSDKRVSNPSPSSLGPPPLPPPTYGFHMLDRRTIVLADGAVRSYFALPPDYQDFTPPPRPNSMSIKRKFVDDFARQKQQLLQYANLGTDEYRVSKYMRVAGGGFHNNNNNNNNNNNAGLRQDVRVDPAVMKAFLHFVKLIHENPNHRKNYETGNNGTLQCLACPRSSKDFPDVHALIMHAYNSDNVDLRVDHLGLHKALCVIMGWDSLRAPDISRAYQHLPAEEVAANKDDLIMWPPMVIISNTNTGKGRDGRMEGLGNKAMDSKLRDLGFSGGKSKSLYSRDGHLGITVVKFASDQLGLKEAMRLTDHFEKEHHGRRDWAHVQSTASGNDEESNPNLIIVDPKTGERRRILYGYLATVSDLDKVDSETRKKVVIESKREKLQPSK